MQDQVIQKPRCKKCGSTQIYRRLNTKEIVCQLCGHIEKEVFDFLDG